MMRRRVWQWQQLLGETSAWHELSPLLIVAVSLPVLGIRISGCLSAIVRSWHSSGIRGAQGLAMPRWLCRVHVGCKGACAWVHGVARKLAGQTGEEAVMQAFPTLVSVS